MEIDDLMDWLEGIRTALKALKKLYEIYKVLGPIFIPRVVRFLNARFTSGEPTDRSPIIEV